MTTMQAVRAHKRGGPEQLVYESAPRPAPAAGEVLVSVHAASITNGELAWDATWTDSFDGTGSDRTPVVPSHEVSGVVAELGSAVTGLAVGDEVYGLIPFTRDGATAEYVTVPADALAAKPSRLDHAGAAAVPLAALTAWQALVGHASLTAGQHVLVHGGAGGVGSFAVQIAAALGARVTATASARDREFVARLGADQVIDYAGDRFEDRVDGADVVLDTVGGDTLARSWAVLRPGGTLISIVQPPNPADAASRGARGVFFVVEPDRTGLEAVTELIDDGGLTPVVDRVVPLSETRAAYEALQSEHPRGKIVIRVSEDNSVA
ncbi:NADPH:quinone reductase-like Zn-dependent oxidoreductase [Streptomyces sp. Ag109_O5-1]|uniref:NADP-dependent oxidoreductase n=1 Tax=Streptomyces sp. Ag109_O5-1 TaxID=1938851 RepID=UPI000FAE4C94|nr:NADP-dependent oxidoreductase [Streptomyces sp. Ag109_O5-1]RPE37752.1 NADPH:quinone reductase-like Zn-dependent oxidoreductase [Streptomyces sp. Ag109_O5-1]